MITTHGAVYNDGVAYRGNLRSIKASSLSADPCMYSLSCSLVGLVRCGCVLVCLRILFVLFHRQVCVAFGPFFFGEGVCVDSLEFEVLLELVAIDC